MTVECVSISSGMCGISSRLTQVLNILVGEELKSKGRGVRTRLETGSEGFENDDAVSCDSREKGQTIGKGGPVGGRVEGDVGQAVSKDREQEGEVAQKPGAVCRC